MEETKLFVLRLVKFSLLFLLFCKTSNFHLLKEEKDEIFLLEVKEKNFVPNVKLNLKQKNKLKEVNLVFDTGSSFSLINHTNEFISKETKTMKVQSINQSFQKDFKVFELDLYDQEKKLLANNINFASAKINTNIFHDGIIGNDILSRFKVFIELPEKIILIKNSIKNIDLRNYKKLPIHFNGNHIFIECDIQDRKYNFLIDTGAGVSLFDEIFLKDEYIIPKYEIQFYSITGELEKTTLYELKEICIQGIFCQKKVEFIAKNLSFLFENKKETNLKGILGQNWLSQFSILIDFQSQFLYIKER